MNPSKRLSILNARAARLSRKSPSEGLAKICREILSLDPGSADANRFLALWHTDREEFVKALPYLRALTSVTPPMEGLDLPLTVALEEAGELHAALEQARALVRKNKTNYEGYVYLGSVLCALGRIDEAVRTYGLAAHLNPQLRNIAQASSRGPRFAAKRLQQCISTLASFGKELHANAVAIGREAFPQDDLSRIEHAYWRKLHDGPVDTKPGQHPHVFFVPGLDRCAWFERAEFSWVPTLESQFPAILAELQAGYQGDEDTTAYLKEDAWDPSEWDGLVKSKRWAASHFFDGAKRIAENCERYPQTTKILEALPLVKIDDIPVEALFSVLEPGTRIPPHHGTDNTRLTVHLPLVVPPGCTLTVDGEARDVVPGKVMLFDDTFEHEANNPSDEVRIVLIFEVWHPDLTPAERLVVDESHAAFLSWIEDRALLQAIESG